MKSIKEMALHFKCDPIELNKLFLRHDITVKTEFGINDGFIDEAIYSFIEEEYNSMLNSLLAIDFIKENKQASVTIKPGYYVYFLLNESELVYIGQSCSLLNRIHIHLEDKKQFTHIFYTETIRVKMDELEQFYIQYYSPKLNLTKTGILVLFSLFLKRYI